MSYERKGFRENEGRNTWWQVLSSLKTFFKYADGERWDYWEYPEFFKWNLDSVEAKWLNRSVNAFFHRCTGPVRKVIAALPSLGPFQHICLCLPFKHDEHRFRYEYESVFNFKKIIPDMLAYLFPDHKIGYYFRVAYQPGREDAPQLHIHIALSSLRYAPKDSEYLETFNKQAYDDQPYHALYFLTDPIMLSTSEMANFIEPVWREVIEDVTGRKVKSSEPLVCVTGQDGQTILDRWRILHYIANQHLHTYNNIESLSLSAESPRAPKKVKLQKKPYYGIPSEPFWLSQSAFVRQYHIMPLRTFGVQFRGRGFFHGAATFAKASAAASRLVVNEPREEGERRRFLFDLPVAEIRERAVAARQCLDAGDMTAFRHIRARYRLGVPKKELKILKDLERKRQHEESLRARRERKLTERERELEKHMEEFC